MDTKKLFHAIVVMGMTAAASCSSGTTEPPQDASTGADGSKDSGGKDALFGDTGSTDASSGGDGFTGWLGC
jgi:hypothetical protein